MEWTILFAGPVGAGKTQAIRTASEVDVVSTEARATDATAQIKANTTVAMDMGILRLDDTDRIRLLGAPGQDRFDFMWDILLQQARGVVILIDHSRPQACEDLRFYAQQLRERAGARWLPWVVGVTHVDVAPSSDLSAYGDLLEAYRLPGSRGPVPVLRADAREHRDVRALLLAMTAMLEVSARFVPPSTEQRAA